jgi:WXG100 family type VII secretion target
MRYRVELSELEAFVAKLQAFERHAEAITARIDGQIAHLHTTWSGDAADAHRAQHEEWIAAATQMREALTGLREAANNAHRNYTDAVDLNVAMLT